MTRPVRLALAPALLAVPGVIQVGGMRPATSTQPEKR